MRHRSVIVRRLVEDAVGKLRGAVVGAGAFAVTLAGAGTALAASPSPAGAAAGDPRSAGEGPGLVGDPVVALLIVAVIAVASLVATLAYVRMTGGAGGSRSAS